MSDILSYKVLTVDLWDGLLSQKVMAPLQRGVLNFATSRYAWSR